MTEVREVRRALLAVYDKAGVVELARALVELGVALVSSGGTAAALRDGGVDVTPVEEVTGFPEMLDGRVKTLHPRIHGGLLADSRKPEHLEQLAEHGIEPFDLVVVNLYPFRETVASGAGVDDVIEKIDIGGPAMVRAAAKNFESVGSSWIPSRYAGDRGRAPRTKAGSPARPASGLPRPRSRTPPPTTPRWRAGSPSEAETEAAGVRRTGAREGRRPPLRGEPSPARRPLPRGVRAPACSAAPSAPGQGHVVQQLARRGGGRLARRRAARPRVRDREAQQPVRRGHRGHPGRGLRRAFDCDTVSAFGGIVAFDAAVDGRSRRGDARGVHRGRDRARVRAGGPHRLRRAPEPAACSRHRCPMSAGSDVRAMPGGALVQDATSSRRDATTSASCPRREPTEAEWRDLLFAWTIAWRVKSNTIVLVRDGRRSASAPARCRGSTRRGSRRGRRGTARRAPSLATRRVLPVPRRARGRRRRRRHRRDPSRRIEGRRRRPRGRGGTRDGRRAHRAPPLPALTSPSHRRPRGGVVSR